MLETIITYQDEYSYKLTTCTLTISIKTNTHSLETSKN